MNMKAIISIITISAAASLLNAPILCAQETVPEPAGLPQAQEAMQGHRRGTSQVQAQDELAKAQAEAQKAQAQAQKEEAEAKATFAQAQHLFQNSLVRAPDHGAGKALVIRSTESDLKEQTQMEEDLAVMTRILEKAASERSGGQPHGATAMGIDVFYTPAASPLRSLYLDGYGALFMLKVGFPLLPPPHAEGQQEKTEANSDWEDAKQELYGQRGGGRVMAAPSEPYDEERVNRLKEGLLESLKNATNIRGLKPDDSITVCVFGGPSSGQPKAKAYVKRSTGSGEAGSWILESGRVGGPMRQTIMTIRVKKSDVDAFAKGAMTLEVFRKRAHVVSYAGSPEAGMSFGAMGPQTIISGGMGGMGGFGAGGGGGGGGIGGGGVVP